MIWLGKGLAVEFLTVFYWTISHSNTDVLTTSGNLILGTISADESFSIKSATNMKVTDDTNTSGTWDNTNTQTPSTDNGSSDNSGSNSNSSNNSGNNSNTDKPETSIPFTDVSEKDWYYNAVKYAYDNKVLCLVCPVQHLHLMQYNTRYDCNCAVSFGK